MSLQRIGAVLAARGSEPESVISALRLQLERLGDEHERIERRMRSVRSTITKLEEGGPLVAEEMFDGFEADPYEAEARERWGDAAVDAAQARVRSWTKAQAEQAREAYPRLHAELRELYAAGVAPADPRMQDLVRRHYEVTSQFWTPDADAYAALGRMYVEDERFRSNIGAGNDGAVEYLCQAMQLYADRMRDAQRT